jgi:mRNA interferase MazF
MKRGEIWHIDYPSPAREGSEPYGHGPVVIVSSNSFNDSAIQTILVAIITSNLKLARAPGNLIVFADQDNGLAGDSVINVSQILVINKNRLDTKYGQLDSVSLELLNAGLRKIFALEL